MSKPMRPLAEYWRLYLEMGNCAGMDDDTIEALRRIFMMGAHASFAMMTASLSETTSFGQVVIDAIGNELNGEKMKAYLDSVEPAGRA